LRRWLHDMVRLQHMQQLSAEKASINTPVRTTPSQRAVSLENRVCECTLHGLITKLQATHNIIQTTPLTSSFPVPSSWMIMSLAGRVYEKKGRVRLAISSSVLTGFLRTGIVPSGQLPLLRHVCSGKL
jgi:hypothetical protein